MRLAAMLLSLALPVQAETLSQEIAHSGLAATQSRLLALTSPGDAERFATGGVTFLRAIEVTFQERYAMGLTDRTGMLPLLRLPLNDNPHPATFDPAAIVTLFAHAAENLTAAQMQLMTIPAGSDFTVEIALDDLWFDVDANGSRSPDEGLADILGTAVLGGEPDTAVPHALPTVQFDVADAAWLAAHAHLLTGVSDLIRAYDPTEPITRVMAADVAMSKLGQFQADMIFGGQASPDSFDLIAMVLATLNQTPDAAMMAAAQVNFLSMIALNREFWTRVAAETDNDREWLPNDAQASALGVEVPKGTGAAWLAVLADLEAALTGQKLLPYWRVGPPAGINLDRMFRAPRPFDVAGWLQGWAALPYLEKGPLVDKRAIDAFDALMSGQAPLFALYLN